MTHLLSYGFFSLKRVDNLNTAIKWWLGPHHFKVGYHEIIIFFKRFWRSQTSKVSDTEKNEIIEERLHLWETYVGESFLVHVWMISSMGLQDCMISACCWTANNHSMKLNLHIVLVSNPTSPFLHIVHFKNLTVRAPTESFLAPQSLKGFATIMYSDIKKRSLYLMSTRTDFNSKFVRLSWSFTWLLVMIETNFW